MPGFIAGLDFFRSDETTGFTIRRPRFQLRDRTPSRTFLLKHVVEPWVVHFVMGKLVLGQEQLVGLEQP